MPFTLHSIDPFGAVLGGLISFLSPCVLAVVPGYIAYLGGASVEPETRTRSLLVNALLFIAGFTFVFVLLFAVLQALVAPLPGDYKTILTDVGAVVVIFLGLQFLGLFRVGVLFREARLSLAHRLPAGSPVAAALVGMAFSLGWTPCVGPILTFILLRASTRDLAGGTSLMLLYSAGLAVPFLLTALLIQRARPVLTALNRHARTVEAVSGALLVFAGLLLLTGQFAQVNQWFGPLSRYLPSG